jgi:hypothetical protein
MWWKIGSKMPCRLLVISSWWTRMGVNIEGYYASVSIDYKTLFVDEERLTQKRPVTEFLPVRTC